MLRRFFVVILGVMISFLITGSSYAFADDDVLGAWTFGEGSGTDIHDVSGNGNDGVLIGEAQWGDGKFGKALYFDGSSGHVEVPFIESMEVLNLGSFTLAAWFMASEIPSVNRTVFQQGDAGPNSTGRTWLFVHSSNEIRSYLGGTTTGTGIGVEAGVWYHGAVVVTEGGGTYTIQLYINGEPAGNPNQRAMENADGVYFIGCNKATTGVWNGAIDDVVLFSKALDATEIAILMNNGIRPSAVKPNAKLAACWGEIKSNSSEQQ